MFLRLTDATTGNDVIVNTDHIVMVVPNQAAAGADLTLAGVATVVTVNQGVRRIIQAVLQGGVIVDVSKVVMPA